MKKTPLPEPNPFTTIETLAAPVVEPSLSSTLEALLDITGQALAAVQREPGRTNHSAADHAALCRIEMTLGEMHISLRNRN
jgi:hypothetical protein